MFIDKENKQIIYTKMTKEIRNICKKGGTIKVNIKRNKRLIKWGDELTLIIRNGKILYNSICEDFDIPEGDRRLNDIISYFLYGDKYDF